ncbi:MAG: DNA polymerase III subunit alpha [Labilithrix sp.]|nr:DNA polymerase III subunit alpha [Labilithrix sp.]MCW5817400.1 DNA polymerase III subunit alpha [Labilithrix sp.]
MSEFVHLHVHSQYSMLDGALKVKNLCKLVQKQGMNAVALTDHGNMFGAISFYKTAKDAGIKSILGAELEVVVNGHGHHLPLLAATEEGYKNLVALVSRGYVEPDPGGPPGVPCVPLSALDGKTKGLIGLTGCMGGLVAQSILEQGPEAGAKMLGQLKEMFEPGSLYVELQDHGLPEQPILKGILKDLAKRWDLPLVATNDVHYGTKDDADANLFLTCIKTGRSFEEAKERHHGSHEMFLKTPAEMSAAFPDEPEAIKATLEIAEKCQLKLKLGNPMLPSFGVPEGMDEPTYFRKVAADGLEARFAEFEAVGKTVDKDAYRKRLAWEADVICQMKFPGYFLIVWDFIRFGKENGVPVGPGRGSGAGSIVAYAMRITDLDPIPFNLLFERFLNPERVSMPDFDVDFCMDKRERVIQYVQKKYGETSVGQIATFAELKAKSVIKDVARALAIPPFEAQQVASLIPNKTPAETYTITESLGIEPKLKARYETEPKIKQLLDEAIKLEGLTRHAGKHAAGIVISEGPLWDHVPVFKDGKSEGFITQYYKDDVEQAGLVKFDFLGLKTLTVIDIAQARIHARPDQQGKEGKDKFDINTIGLDDRASYQLMASGETKGVFQLESSGMQQLFKDLQPDAFEDIVAAVALYRPGPLGTGMVKDFVDCKHGRKPIAQMHDKVDHILVPTYGVIVYQEQVMQIAQALAGYSLGGADLLRRAMGKKKPEEMAKQKGIFVEGSLNNGVTEEDADRIFGLLEYFAGYGFNKSHSAAYALITYQTAFLKAHYPAELLCGIMTSDKEKIDKVVRTIADARAMGVTVLPPDVNESDIDFKVVYTHPNGDKKIPRNAKSSVARDRCGPQIRFGLGAVRGLGGAALEALLEARKEGGPFVDLFDFASRVDAKRVNKGVFEALVQCGAFDSTLASRGITRADAFESIDIALERSRAASRDRERGQTNLFGLFDAAPPKTANGGAPAAGGYKRAEPWDRREMLVREQKALGFFVSGHPLERYVRGTGGLAKLDAVPINSLSTMKDWALVKVVGTVEGYRERIFKDGGGKVAFLELEDLTGRVTCKVRGNQIDQLAPTLTSGEPVLLTAKVSFPRRDDGEDDGAEEGPREPTLFINEATLLSESVKRDTKAVAIRLLAEKTTPAHLDRMAAVLGKSEGNCPVSLVLAMKDGAEALLSLGRDFRVEVSDEVLSGLEKIFGEQVAELR